MITVYVEVPFASFRKSFARSFAETYSLPPPSTIYGMLLSLVGEHFRKRHEGVKLAFAYKQMPKIATTVRKLSRYKYGIPSKQSSLGNAPDFVETLCGIEFLCWIDSSEEKLDGEGKLKGETLEQRILTALKNPQEITRKGIICLGLSDDAVNDISLCQEVKGRWFKYFSDENLDYPIIEKAEEDKWYRLLPNDKGSLELPVWADHVRGFDTRWQRYELDKEASEITSMPDEDSWQWTQIINPRK
ncbi:MAG TPA: CRISPR-associated protein Cas5 [Pyrinomonadaceae bacterium]|nr:CRISPR-associated protein Cas5 [Pyrinomonadaceae bacterium]